MKPIEKTIWYIESHLLEEISLERLSQIAGVSRFTLSRAFAFATGISLSRYLRKRRLTEAARTLIDSSTSILELALIYQYGSHEAFSRAFKDCFGKTPEQVRRQGHLDGLRLMEARKMSEVEMIEIGEPVIEERGPLLVAGLLRTHLTEHNVEIPGQWQEFAPYLGRIPGQLGGEAYGVVFNQDEEGNFDYLCGVAVSNFDNLQDELGRIRLAPQKYAMFRYGGHVSQIQKVCATIWGEWLPASAYEATDAPFIEHYPESFDGHTGQGGFEIWLPLKA